MLREVIVVAVVIAILLLCLRWLYFRALLLQGYLTHRKILFRSKLQLQSTAGSQ